METWRNAGAQLLRKVSLIAFPGVIVSACSPQSVGENMLVVASVSEAEWSAVAGGRILLAHQSVGQNILNGLADLVSRRGVKLNIVANRDASLVSAGVCHFAVGESGEALGKMQGFRQVVARQDLSTVGMVLLNLCYVEFAHNTDARVLANEYASTLQELQLGHPQTRFVAVTAPLATVQTGPRAWARKFLGRTPYGAEENSRRHQFIEALRGRFKAAALFDLARLEAAGEEMAVLHPQLTTDDGYLKLLGRQQVGAAFTKFIAANFEGSRGP